MEKITFSIFQNEDLNKKNIFSQSWNNTDFLQEAFIRTVLSVEKFTPVWNLIAYSLIWEKHFNIVCGTKIQIILSKICYVNV